MFFEKRKIGLLTSKINLQIANKAKDGFYSIFSTNFFAKRLQNTKDYESLEKLYEGLLEYDIKYKIPYDVGVKLNELEMDEDNLIAIRRINIIKEPLNWFKEDRYLDMVKNSHEISNGIPVSRGRILNPSEQFKPFKDLTGYMEIFKQENTCEVLFVCSFPKSKLNDKLVLKDINDIDGVYEIKDDNYVVPPSNIKGVIIKNNITHDLRYSSIEYIKNKSK